MQHQARIETSLEGGCVETVWWIHIALEPPNDAGKLQGLVNLLEENYSGASFRPFAGIWLELRLDVDCERRTARGEQAGLRMQSRPDSDPEDGRTLHRGSVEVLVVFLHVYCIVFRCFSFVDRIEVEARVFVLDLPEIHSQSFLDAVWNEIGDANRPWLSYNAPFWFIISVVVHRSALWYHR
jgi:hypothetical protein